MNFVKSVFSSCLGVLLAFFAIFFLFVIVVSISVAALSSPAETKNNSVLSIPMSGVVVDYNEGGSLESLLSSEQKIIDLSDVLWALKEAKGDDRIKGVSLKMNSLSCSYAASEEIRKALQDFKESGKFVYAYSGLYTQKAYFIASVADSVFINPEGSWDFSGISSSSLFCKAFLEKVGVEMQVVRCGAYKSYAETFSNDTMSAENREQMEDMISSIWDVILEGISESRSISKEKLSQLADDYLAVRPAQYLLSSNLVDGLAYGDEYENYLRSRLSLSASDEVPMVDVSQYVAAKELLDLGGDKLAVVYLDGEIDNGNRDGISSVKTIKLLSEVEKDSAVKAVVLRVNSPGGSAYGSEQICHAVEKLKARKPVVASFGGYAASGGYYISSNADKIVSNASTITGSIGVIAMVPNAKDLAEKLGVHYETVKTNANADLLENVFRPMTESERAVVQASVDNFYSTFLKRCATGRGMSVDQVHVYAQGRVWSGDDAAKLNLVDSLGTLNDAIGWAASLAHIGESYTIETYPKKRNVWEELEDFPALGYEKLFGNDVFSKEKYIFEKIRGLERVQTIIPYTIELR